MNLALISHEILLLLLGVGVLLADLWLPAARKRSLGYVAAGGVGIILLVSLLGLLPGTVGADPTAHAFGRMFVLDDLALFFKRFFLIATLIVLLMTVEFADRVPAGIAEYYSLILFAASGMLFAASANDFVLLFVSLELITVTFYVLTGFARSRTESLEASVKYLIMGALSSAFLVYGIALVYGMTGAFNFQDLAAVDAPHLEDPIFLFGLLFVFVGLGFKIAAVPFQMWAPDVYQGAPTPTTAFLAVGSKAAGVVLLLRVLFTAVPAVAAEWAPVIAVVASLTMLYGNLCALPQTNLKRLLGYSSIAHAGYLLLGVASLTQSGQAAVLFYLGGYLFTVLAAFMVAAAVLRETGAEDIESLRGLYHRSPLLATGLTFSMVSLAGIPPLVGFFGKFLLIQAALAAAAAAPILYAAVGVAIVGVVVSLCYYFGVIRAIYWRTDSTGHPLTPSMTARLTVGACLAGIVILGIFPSGLWESARQAVATLSLN
ncbi:MAG: NADH-quinone oxidoreductase subunit N [Verrucomicrobia bacterium]|jgi:NADH-quinone oxidoreductase subunit N|nr:NADH-quinone oxidoreductase subunit N [Verrucomicrobiota bacterium]